MISLAPMPRVIKRRAKSKPSYNRALQRREEGYAHASSPEGIMCFDKTRIQHFKVHRSTGLVKYLLSMGLGSMP